MSPRLMTSNGLLAANGQPVAFSSFWKIIKSRVVLDAAVVPKDNRVWRPGNAAVHLDRVGDMVIEHL